MRKAAQALAKAGMEHDVTGLLRAWSAGDDTAGERLIASVYAELRRQAARCLRRERREHTLRPTALVHEAYLRLVAQREIPWANREQFFAVAATMMRRILVDHARRRAASKRAGGLCRVTLDENAAVQAERDADLLALEQALEELARLDADKVRLVELRFFGGLSLEETAQVLGVSVATVSREWRMAKAWLFHRLNPPPEAGS
jgi:RNA polymerase sigma factor (TIGR02999 family)